MSAIPDIVYSQMERNLSRLADRMLHLVPKLEITHDECLELLAPEDHHSVLKMASKYADLHSSEGWMYNIRVPVTIDGEENPQISLIMRTHAGISPPLKPRDPSWMPAALCAPKVVAWVEARLKAGRDAGLAFHVLRQLQKHCTSGVQMRFMWPVALQLAAMKEAGSDKSNEACERWVAKHTSFKRVDSTPAVTVLFRQALRDTAGWVTSGILLGDNLPNVDGDFVQIGLAGHHTFKWDELTLHRI
jgi:hypothetical protein